MKRDKISEKQWNRIKEKFPPEKKPQGGRPGKSNRKMLDAILYWLNTGIPWKDLPERFGPWQFELAIARRIAQRLEIHYTPIHASWLNMAEIEIGILSRQCLSQALPSFELMARQVNAWTLHRNAVCSTVYWRFSTCDARCKLRKLYPVIL